MTRLDEADEQNCSTGTAYYYASRPQNKCKRKVGPPYTRRRACPSYSRRINLLLLYSSAAIISSPFSIFPFGVDASYVVSAGVTDEDFAEDDDTLEDLLGFDYDETLDISDDEDSNNFIGPQQTSLDDHIDDDTAEKSSDSVIILSSVDGTLTGVSRTSGQVLWKQSNSNLDAPSQKESGRGKESQCNKFLSPLISTSTTKLLEDSNKNNQNSNQWHAVPSIDGTVYLTSGDLNNDNDDGASHKLSTITHIRDLVDRAPFVDAHQRFFVGSRKAMVAAVDEATGEILRVVPKFGNDNEDNLPPSLEGRVVVWIGRLEYTVTVHDLHKGSADLEFSVSEILSVDEMINGDRRAGSSVSRQQKVQEDRVMTTDVAHRRQEDEMEMERLVTDYIAEALRHPSDGDRILRLPAPPKMGSSDDSDGGDVGNERRDGDSSHSSMGHQQGGLSFLVATPSGNVAFRDFEDSSKSMGWVSFDLIDSPVVVAIDASSGHKIRVNMLPDDSSISVSPEKDSVSLLALERQIASLEQQSLPTMAGETSCNEFGECHVVQAPNLSAQGSVVGALENGQLYALPLGERIFKGPLDFPLALPAPPRHSVVSSEMVKVNSNNPTKLNSYNLLGFHNTNAEAADKHHIHLATQDRLSSCTPSTSLYPGCLTEVRQLMSNLMNINEHVASSDLDFNMYLDMLEQETNNRQKTKSKNFFLSIISSWLAPVVALLFVVSFEVGRRERIKAGKRSSSEVPPSSSSNDGRNTARGEAATNKFSNNVSAIGVIELSDEILGYGGHGTIVYRGVLDKRQVAVKRLLKMYHASADREISLLIESDGHPNVVRYFLKESRGDFVYLALELCDMSLNDLIASLSKLRNIRKESSQLSSRFGNSSVEDFESATKNLLLQISLGVRHIHSLRIVHRDIKPQNILLRLQKNKSKALTPQNNIQRSDSDSTTIDNNTTHTACSNTDAKLESFRNQEYVPKISDMGLGKQLAGQSSFGLSTLGTGSVGGGANGTSTGDTGAGAGSVGWQAPEVMAMRWGSNQNNELSTSELEGSPLETSGRTSRSVDIFSLGCIFYCTILPGSHPFGKWYEREAKIMENNPNKADLELVSSDASDLILSMIHKDAERRPTAQEVCEHPYFWTLARRLKFFCELSDRVESCATTTSLKTLYTAQSSSKQKETNDDKSINSCSVLNVFALEKGAVDVFGTSWENKIDRELIDSRRTYDPSSVRDCLRMIRNKHHHYDELPQHVKSRIGSSTDGLSSYISRSLPHLLMHCYHFCVANLAQNDSLALYYRLPISKNLSLKARPKMPVVAELSSSGKMSKKLETISNEDVIEREHHSEEKQDGGILSPSPELVGDPKVQMQMSDASVEPDISRSPMINTPKEVSSDMQEKIETTLLQSNDLTGIIVWNGSKTAKELNCRGWYRSDTEWTERLDAKLRKRDANLARCVDDPRFRTRLCNHWDTSLGTYCPLRTKTKCIFAHGPIELRVREGKRKRWGTLVRKDGLCANPRASGGEDTYGAARYIEKTRKEQGQWTVDLTQKNISKGKHRGAKQSPKIKPKQ